MLPVIPCNAVANVWRAVLNSQRKFAAPAITVMLTPRSIMRRVLSRALRRGPDSGDWLQLSGAAGELALLVVRPCGLAVSRDGVGRRPPANLPLAGFQYGQLPERIPLPGSQRAVAGGTVLIGQTMAASLGAGSVSVLNYGTRLAGVLLAIGPAALGVTVLPRFSRWSRSRIGKH